MTTSVKVTACCSTDKEVIVSINSEQTGETHTLQNGESEEYFVYDDREITAKEVMKSSTD